MKSGVCTCVRIFLLHAHILHQTHIGAHVEMEQRTRFAARLVDDQIVEGVMLRANTKKSEKRKMKSKGKYSVGILNQSEPFEADIRSE